MCLTDLHRVHYTIVANELIAMLWWVNINNLRVWYLIDESYFLYAG